MEKGKGKNPVFPVLETVFLVLLIGAGIFFRFNYYTKTTEIDELLRQSEQFLDGMSDAAFFYQPSPAGTVETYSAVFNVTGVNEGLARLIMIGLESLSYLLFFILVKSVLGTFYGFMFLPVLLLPSFFGLRVGVYEELPVLCLLLYEVMLFLTRQMEEYSDEGPLFFRYAFIGVTMGLSVFLMPGNLIMTLISLFLVIHFLLVKRRIKLIPEVLLLLLAAAVIFFMLLTVRVMNTALLIKDIFGSYIKHFLDPWGTEYLLVAIMLMIFLIIEVIISLMPGKKLEKEIKRRPVSTGGLPEDFVLHRAGDEKDGIVSAAADRKADKKDGAVSPAADSKEKKKEKEEKDKTEKTEQKKKKSIVRPEKKEKDNYGKKAKILPFIPLTIAIGKGKDASLKETPQTEPQAVPKGPENAEIRRNDDFNTEGSVEEREPDIRMKLPKVRPVSKFMPRENETEEEKAKRIAEYREYAENINPNELEFDFDIPYDDDFDVEVKF